MERNEAYKNVLIKILELEKQLSLCDDAIKECDQSAVEAEKKIEEHFAQCANALAARKDTLLSELAHKAASQSIYRYYFIQMLHLSYPNTQRNALKMQN